MSVQPELSPVHARALELEAAGCSVVPAKADGSKAPAGDWKRYQHERASPDQLNRWFGALPALGVGVVCGAVSGGLVMVEFEGRAAHLVPRAAEVALAAGDAELWRRVMGGYVELTPTGGLHMLYRITGGPVPGNQKIARRLGPELDGGRANAVEVLIETRGEGGFVVVAPSAGTVHASGNGWVQITGGPQTIPTLTLDEHRTLCSILRTFDTMPAAGVTLPASPSTPRIDGELAPGEDYEQRTSWAELLGRHGWRPVRTRGRIVDWCRPGKAEGISATTGYGSDDHDLLYVFSSSTVLEPERSYTKFGAYAALEHGGSYAEAARALRLDGYGGERQPLDAGLAPLRTLTELGVTPWPSTSPSALTAGDVTPPATDLPASSSAPSSDGPTAPGAAPTLATPAGEAGASPTSEAEARTSWWRLDLDAIIAGDDDGIPAPAHLARRDGERLLYPGKVNGLIGESESGKTWVALLAVWQAISVGERALVIDFEDTAPGIVGRLRAFGAGPAELAHVAYVSPDEMLHEDARRDLEQVLTEHRPTLIVVDGFNNACTMLGLDFEANRDVIKFYSAFLRPLAATGATVVTIDHVTKSKEGRGSYAIGAQAKRSEATGCLLAVEAVEPFGKGQTGKLKLTVAKDRNGRVRGISGGGKYAGEVEFRSTDEGAVTLLIHAPDMTPREERGPFRPTLYMERVSKFLLDMKEASGAAVERGVPGKAQHVREALALLVAEGYLTRSAGPRNATLYGYVRPFVDGLQEWNPAGGGGSDD